MISDFQFVSSVIAYFKLFKQGKKVCKTTGFRSLPKTKLILTPRFAITKLYQLYFPQNCHASIQNYSKSKICLHKVLIAITYFQQDCRAIWVHPSKIILSPIFSNTKFFQRLFLTKLSIHLGASIQNYSQSQICLHKDLLAITFHKIVVPSGCIHPKLF